MDRDEAGPALGCLYLVLCKHPSLYTPDEAHWHMKPALNRPGKAAETTVQRKLSKSTLRLPLLCQWLSPTRHQSVTRHPSACQYRPGPQAASESESDSVDGRLRGSSQLNRELSQLTRSLFKLDSLLCM